MAKKKQTVNPNKVSMTEAKCPECRCDMIVLRPGYRECRSGSCNYREPFEEERGGYD